VLAQLISVSQPGCTMETRGRLMALWVFGSAACGAYGFDHLDIAHAGDADPVGDIVFQSEENVMVRTGSGMLLIAVQPRFNVAAASAP